MTSAIVYREPSLEAGSEPTTESSVKSNVRNPRAVGVGL